MNSYKWKRNVACVKYHEVELERRKCHKMKLCKHNGMTIHLLIYIYIYIIHFLEKWFSLQGERSHSCIFLYVRTLGFKKKCNRERGGERDRLTHTFCLVLQQTPYEPMTNLSHLVTTIFSSLALLSSSISMASLSHFVVASFSSLALLSFSISTANLS